MTPLETAEPYPHDAGHRPSLGFLPEDHAARRFWEAAVAACGGEDHDTVRRLVEYHDARNRQRSWCGRTDSEATEEARIGLHEIIAGDVTDPAELARQCELIDRLAACYATDGAE